MPHRSTKASSLGPNTLVETQTIDLEGRLRFLDIEPEDAQRVRSLLPLFQAFRDTFVEKFYAHLFAFDESARFLQDAELVTRLKQRQGEHFESMLQSNWNDDYVRERVQVGDSHAEVGIQPDLFLGAYNQYLQHCVRHFARGESAETRQFLEQMLSLVKVVFLDIGLTLDAYFSQSTQNLRSALDMFWKANTELRQFAQLTSHDIKTPLATVANLCEEALDEFREQMPGAACELIEAAQERAYRMSAMVDEILAVTVSPELTEMNEEISSEQALEEALERVRPALAQKGIQLTCAPALPVVWGNRVRLREAIYNVLSNAAKFIEKQPGRIDISAEIHDGHAVFTIADNGPGIPRDELERIFSPFRRLPMHRDRPGSGLGLYFTKNLIEQQGGRVWAQSEPGQGSRFLIQLPLGRPKP